jgi:hypothetical protein
MPWFLTAPEDCLEVVIVIVLEVAVVVLELVVVVVLEPVVVVLLELAVVVTGSKTLILSLPLHISCLF